ncbi:lipoprotein-releasing ABC transporter permease subunit [Larsenimonas suaedae]|uniref:Lipoprotein-releasing ABC transporter permease subunit n=1 Tax=Larsenimonas suaedae TaxID=1851019 RepID=A0ABU1GUW1_9GAMM|nr:lipoprotein-releasing ABC transporter permease subunit [Larsenimonas suaedae]MCM2971102.1 lipoprotein-releasing ABC transporter permease subunit [Larsenimonas suaedae]MDR5895811.1 lipoprotein-releasing ABC transporter permease subunit [Larsenimonas suaedae]
MLDRIPFLVGLRYTRAKRRNHFISFISMTSMLGLTLGVAVMILVLSVMNGFDHELRTRILGMVPHTRIEAVNGVNDWKALAERLEQKSPHIIGAAPYVEQQGMFARGGNAQGAMVQGIEPKAEEKVSIIGKHMAQGSFDSLKEGQWNVVLGQQLARSLGVGVGDRVTLMIPEASVTPGGIFPRMKRFTVSGIFSVGAQLDANLAYANLSDMAKLGRIQGEAQGVRLQLDDLFKANQVTQDIIHQMPPGYRGIDWTYTQGNLFQAIQMEKHMIGLLLSVIVAVAAFNIISTLVMVVTDKHADIAILRTLGATPLTIMGIFIVQGLTIGVVGIILGVIFGIVGALTVADVVAWIQGMFGVTFLDPNVYFISYLPSRLELSDVLVITGFALLLSFLSTLYPAWRAARIQPAEVLRYE